MLIHKERLFQNDLETSYLSIGVKSAKKQIYKASENQDEILMEDRTFSQSEMEVFSKEGQLIEWKLSFANDNNPSGGRLNYNEKGQLKEEFEYEGDKLIQKVVYYYDGKGRLIQTEYFRFKNSIKAELNYKVKYTYDDIRPNIERNEEEEVIFSEREQPNQEVWYNDRDIITKLRSYHYDAKGRIIGIIEARVCVTYLPRLSSLLLPSWSHTVTSSNVLCSSYMYMSNCSSQRGFNVFGLI